MTELLDEISRHHFPNPAATPEQLDAFERRMGWRLDPDLRAFYLHCDGAELFKQPDSPFRILPLSRIVRARLAILGEDSDEWGPASWYALCELHDSNFILLDVGQQRAGRYPLRDGYREMFPRPEYCQEIAPSFQAFLAEALRSGGRWFWLGSDDA
ncbi:SMI1/KNR4 family protein [Myxococcaceae bacterium GXIMD 01537]